MKIPFIVYLSLIVLIAGIIGAIRYKKIDSAYYPFLYFLWLGGLNEILSLTLIKLGLYSTANSNIYVLLEALLLTYFFKQLGIFRRDKTLYIVLMTAHILIWVFEVLLIRGIMESALYARIFFSFAIVLMSISCINQMLTSQRTPLKKNALFIICIGFIIFFTYKVLVNSFWLYGLKQSRSFVLNIYTILIYINLFCNLIYALATLWIPRKQPSLLP
jgi:hypothetical protein